MSVTTYCRRCPIMCGYGPLTAGMEELSDAPKNIPVLPEGYLRETEEGWKDDLKEFCMQNYQEA